jgi:hypothetical protein
MRNISALQRSHRNASEAFAAAGLPGACVAIVDGDDAVVVDRGSGMGRLYGPRSTMALRSGGRTWTIDRQYS